MSETTDPFIAKTETAETGGFDASNMPPATAALLAPAGGIAPQSDPEAEEITVHPVGSDGAAPSPTPAEKQKSKSYLTSLILVASVVFLSYLQYGSIVPTLWLYLKSFGADESFYGVVFAAWNLSANGMTLLFGILSDFLSFKTVFSLVLVVNIAGNVVHSLARDKWWIFVGRLLSGGTYGVGMAFVARATTEKERTKILARINGISTIGIVLGPALNLGFNYIDWTIGPFHINNLTCPSYFMIIVLLIDEIAILIGLREPPPVKDDAEHPTEAVAAAGPTKPDQDIVSIVGGRGPLTPGHPHSINEDVSTETSRLLPAAEPATQPLPKKMGTKKLKKQLIMLKNSLSWTVVLILIYQLVGATNLATLEALATVITDAYFGFSTIENSVMYAIIAGIFMVAYLTISIITRWFSDRTLLWVGVIIQGAGALWCFFGWGFAPREIGDVPLWLWGCSVGLIILSTPFINLSSSVFSKSVEMAAQGTWQGVYGLVTGFAQFIGPFYGGFAFSSTSPNAVALLAGFLALWGTLLAVYVPLFFIIPKTLEKMRLREESRKKAVEHRGDGSAPTASV
ncbi:hypothetical protein PAPYR_1264 [Paratrimastix pyriformis]|uniref:Major facilitator superfamily (MFS) profile domain-containing protein n=1 Tax=Paratrimastix pyriformis TaxID=342808 RepID=A0ABQ8UZ82_9EUKA|nr:hypothetical protein PAPYR_1264 [Paratrimastix pyriformis]